MQTFSLSSAKWSFRDCTKNTWLPAIVPGCVHSDLRRAGKIPDPFWANNEADLQWIGERDWEYRTTFRASESLLQEDVIELVADGLDTVATIWLNGKKIGTTDNMFLGYRWEVKQYLRKGQNELRIRFHSAEEYVRTQRLTHAPREINDPVGGCTRIRKQQCQFGWDWAPRLVTAGIWRDLRLEGWSHNRVESIHLTQTYDAEQNWMHIQLLPELAHGDLEAACQWQLLLNDQLVVEGEGNEIIVRDPQRWWPAGQGEQPLYTLLVTVTGTGGDIIGHWKRRIGLRTITLERKPDQWGESFQFTVNGRPIFAKGANWVPAHSFVASLSRADYERDLRAAAAANMNMIRVWGGGIYESEDFYDLCDELGLLVWQDFMFACTLYPGDNAFVESVRAEAISQIRRLRHRACLALWCGNNEIWSLNLDVLEKPDPKSLVYREAYERIFHETLPSQVAQHDGATAYWPSSPWSGDVTAGHAIGTQRGDTHYWDVWHARHPVKDYEQWPLRFASEFGMQSYSSPATNAEFCSPDDDNVFGPAMENHQKNRSGNQIILDYVSRRYRFPRGQNELIYLSQLNQAYCMQVGVEHYRRQMPRCMGALYWQLNDCWPVTSWSSIEHNGRWKALHYAARRFFAPMIVSARLSGDEAMTIGNYRSSTLEYVELFTVSDAPAITRGTLHWSLCHFDGRLLKKGRKAVVLHYGESVLQQKVDLTTMMKYGRDSLYLRIALDVKSVRVSESTVFLAPPRFLSLPQSKGTKISVKKTAKDEAVVRITSPVFQHAVALDILGTGFQASDNFFDLYPNETKTISLKLKRPASTEQIKKRLSCHSLVDSYGGG